MRKNGTAPPPGFIPSTPTAPSAPPTYAQAVGGVPPTSPYTPNHTFYKGPEIVTTVVPVGPRNTHMICPHCRAEIDTKTQAKPGPIAYLAGALLCMFGCFLGCCLIPCCMDSCMITQHYCPSCQGYIATFP